MKHQTGNVIADAFSARISLQSLVDNLVSSLPDTITRNRIFVENEVPSEFKMNTGQDNVVSVINELLTTVVTNARNTSILVTAERFSDTVTLNVEDRNNYNGYALAFSLMAVEEHARFVGGNVSIKGAQKRVATVSFSFPETSGVSKNIY